MQAIRQIVDAEQLCPFIDIPGSMRNTKVEIIVMPLAVQETPPSRAGNAALISGDVSETDLVTARLNELYAREDSSLDPSLMAAQAEACPPHSGSAGEDW
jgi:hypothetical protein